MGVENPNVDQGTFPTNYVALPSNSISQAQTSAGVDASLLTMGPETFTAPCDSTSTIEGAILAQLSAAMPWGMASPAGVASGPPYSPQDAHSEKVQSAIAPQSSAIQYSPGIEPVTCGQQLQPQHAYPVSVVSPCSSAERVWPIAKFPTANLGPADSAVSLTFAGPSSSKVTAVSGLPNATPDPAVGCFPTPDRQNTILHATSATQVNTHGGYSGTRLTQYNGPDARRAPDSLLFQNDHCGILANAKGAQVSSEQSQPSTQELYHTYSRSEYSPFARTNLPTTVDADVSENRIETLPETRQRAARESWPLPVRRANKKQRKAQVSLASGTGIAQPKVRRYRQAKPSRFCHICARSADNVEMIPCKNVKFGVCRKSVCAKCCGEYGCEVMVSDQAGKSVACPHCTKTCPPKAQCRTYQKTNEKRRITCIKKRMIIEDALASGGDLEAALREHDML